MARDDQDTSDSTDEVIESNSEAEAPEVIESSLEAETRFNRPANPWPIDPYVESGIFLAQHLNELVQSIDSTNFVGAGGGRPDYAVAGTLWCRQESSSKFSFYIYNGAEDLLIGDSDGIGLDQINEEELIVYFQNNLDFGVTKFGPAANKRDGDVTPMEGDYKIGQLEDVYVTTPIANKNALLWDTTDSKWENKPVVTSFNGSTGDISPQEGDYSLGMLSDTDVDVVADRQVLGYKQGASEPWQPFDAVMTFNGRSGQDIMPKEADYKLEMLGDVALDTLAKDDMLQFNGSSWENNPPKLIDTELNFAGPVDPTVTAPVGRHADIWIANKEGKAHSTFTGIAGNLVRVGNALGYSTNHNVNGDKVPDGTGGAWFLLGDVFSAAVTSIGSGAGIAVDSSTPSTPVVSVKRETVDLWYADKNHLHTGVYEPVIGAKGTAFNKNFGTTAGTVAQGNHLHTGVYSPIGHSHGDEYATKDHRHDDLYEPIIRTKNSAFNKSFGGTGAAITVARSDHTHNGYSPSSHNHDTLYSKLGHTHSGYEPAFTKKTAFNKNFGSGYTDVARGDHTHSDSGVIAPHTHPLSAISGGTASGSTPFVFNAGVECKKALNVSGGAFTVAAYMSCSGYIYSATVLRSGGDVIAYYSSDESLKDNIRSIDNVLDKVCQIRSIEFEWNDKQEDYDGTDVGVSAQSVQAVFPSLVAEREKDGNLGVRYEKLVGPAIGAIAELRDMVVALQNEVADLKAKLGESS